MGIHVAGADDLGGYATLVTCETLKECLAKFGDVPAQSQSFYHDKRLLEAAPIPGNFSPCYYGSNVVIPSATKLEKTPLYGAWGKCPTRPGALHVFENADGVLINPMHVALKNYAGPLVECDGEMLENAVDSFLQMFTPLTKSQKRDTYEFEAAASGIPGVPYFDSLDRSKSSGYPYNTMVGYKKGKTAFFGSEGDFEFTSQQCEELKQSVKQLIDDARKGIRSEVIFTDFLKDELRKHAKVDSGNTRMISATPLAYALAVRQYFMSFSMAVMNTRLFNGIGVGMNVYGDDWDTLANLMQTKGKLVFAGDYSKFDSSQQPRMMWAVLDIINRWYGDSEENQMIRKTLWCDVVNSKHINGDKIYEWTHSLPSGHPLTTIINSIYNHLAFRMAWQLLGLHIDDFNRQVYLVTYGDDNAVNVSGAAAEYFHQNSVIEIMPQLGLTYTSENKDEVDVPNFRSLTQISFLKRTFKFDEHFYRWLAPLELETILFMPYYIRKNADREQIVVDVFEKACEELALHGDEVFNRWFGVFKQKYLEKLGLVPRYNRRERYASKCLACEDTY